MILTSFLVLHIALQNIKFSGKKRRKPQFKIELGNQSVKHTIIPTQSLISSYIMWKWISGMVSDTVLANYNTILNPTQLPSFFFHNLTFFCKPNSNCPHLLQRTTVEFWMMMMFPYLSIITALQILFHFGSFLCCARGVGSL